jgi:hypothetical protein
VLLLLLLLLLRITLGQFKVWSECCRDGPLISQENNGQLRRENITEARGICEILCSRELSRLHVIVHGYGCEDFNVTFSL